MRKKGFTLIELMIVVAIIGILAAIAIPKFAELIRKSQEGATKGSLGALRSALNIYYADMEGYKAHNLDSLIVNAKYLSAIPPASVSPYHTTNNTSVNLPCDEINPAGLNGCESAFWATAARSAEVTAAESIAAQPSVWGYLWWMDDVFVACSHTDSKGSFWSNY